MSCPRAFVAPGSAALAAVLLVSGGCAVARRDATPDLVVRPPTAFDVYVEDGERTRHAIVDPGSEATATVERLELIWSDPAPRPGHDLAKEQRWVFAGLAAPAAVRLRDGQVLEHPDPATMDELGRALDASPPDVEAVLAGLARLYRCESRGALLARAAAAPDLHPTSLATLLGAVTAQRARVALGPGPDAIPVGGEARDALVPALIALAARAEIGPAEARAILDAAADLPAERDRRAVLVALVRAPSPAIEPPDALEAAARLQPAERRAALIEVAQRLPLTPEDLEQTLELTTTLPEREWQADVLVALVGRADPGRVRQAASHLGGAEGQRVVQALDAHDRGR